MSIFSRLLDAEPPAPRPGLSASLRAVDAADAEKERRLEAERLAIAMNAVQRADAMAGRHSPSIASAEALSDIKAALDRLFWMRPARPREVDMSALEREVAPIPQAETRQSETRRAEPDEADANPGGAP